MPRILPLLLFVLILFAAACSSDPDIEIPEDIAEMENVAIYPGDAEPKYDITFSKEAVFGDTDEIFISSISGIAVDESGNLFLADNSEAIVHAYDPEGNYRFNIGRRGEGPGEFNSTYQPILHNANLYVLDIQQQRASVFNPSDGSFIQNIRMAGGGQNFSGFPLGFYPLSGDRFLVYYNSMENDGDRYHRKFFPRILDSEGEILQSDIVDFKPGEMFMLQSENSIQITSLPYMGESRYSLTQDEEIIWGFTDRVFLQILSTDGEYKRSIYHSRQNPPLDRTAFLENYEDEAIRNSIRGLGIPDVRQAFLSFIIDSEDRIWIALTTEDMQENEWWVLDKEGEKLAAFMRPASVRLLAAKNGKAYFFEENEVGLQEVVSYRIEFEES
ncbi:MAG: 6-bladed beta-propeller [Balneolaceae bacterium]|nr:MAG: 6-bladed beta-propeller [Balneolaceae bacterium]